MLDIDIRIMAVTLVIFFTMLYVLNAIVFRPLLQFMDSRDKAISKDLELAKSSSNNTDELLGAAEANIDEAKTKASLIRQEAIDKAKAVQAEAVLAKHKELESSYEHFINALSNQKRELETSLLSQMPLIKESMKAKFSSF